MNTSNHQNWNAGQWLAFFCKIVIALIVAVFLALHSFNFFAFVFPPEQIYYSYLGFGLTGGAVIGYLLILKYGSQSSLNKTIAMIMLLVCTIGELLTAGYGMQVEAWRSSGLTMTNEELTLMVRVVQMLGLAHAFALIFQVAGSDIMDAFSTPSKDITPTVITTNMPTPHPLTIPQIKTSPVSSDENFPPKQ